MCSSNGSVLSHCSQQVFESVKTGATTAQYNDRWHTTCFVSRVEGSELVMHDKIQADMLLPLHVRGQFDEYNRETYSCSLIQLVLEAMVSSIKRKSAQHMSMFETIHGLETIANGVCAQNIFASAEQNIHADSNASTCTAGDSGFASSMPTNFEMTKTISLVHETNGLRWQLDIGALSVQSQFGSLSLPCPVFVVEMLSKNENIVHRVEVLMARNTARHVLVTHRDVGSRESVYLTPKHSRLVFGTSLGTRRIKGTICDNTKNKDKTSLAQACCAEHVNNFVFLFGSSDTVSVQQENCGVGLVCTTIVPLRKDIESTLEAKALMHTVFVMP